MVKKVFENCFAVLCYLQPKFAKNWNIKSEAHFFECLFLVIWILVDFGFHLWKLQIASLMVENARLLLFWNKSCPKIFPIFKALSIVQDWQNILKTFFMMALQLSLSFIFMHKNMG